MRAFPRPTVNLGLLGTFAIASAIPIVLLGLVLGTYLGQQIRDRDVSSAVRALELATRLGVTPS